MNCDVVESLLARYLSGELPARQKESVADHLADCPPCREALAFHRDLESRLEGQPLLPERLRERISTPRPALLARLLGDSTMKKIVLTSTLATALVASALFLTPRNATASTPEEIFKSMRAALAKAARNGELSFNITANKEGNVTVSGTLDGRPLPPDFPLNVDISRDGDTFDVTVTVDFSPENYRQIKFGKNTSTIIFAPKKEPNEKYQVELDPKSKLPKAWTTWAYENGQWTTSRFNFNPKPTAPPTKDDDTVIKARVKIQLGGTATITSKPG